MNNTLARRKETVATTQCPRNDLHEEHNAADEGADEGRDHKEATLHARASIVLVVGLLVVIIVVAGGKRAGRRLAGDEHVGAVGSEGLAGAVLEVLAGGGGHLGESRIGLNLPKLADRRALGRLAVGLVAAVTLDRGVLGEHLLEVVVLDAGRNLLARNVDKAVVVLLLGKLVGQSSGKDGAHLVGVEGRDLGPLTRTGNVAAVLAEEKGDAVVLEPGNLLVVSGDGVRRLVAIAPRIVVELCKGQRRIMVCFR